MKRIYRFLLAIICFGIVNTSYSQEQKYKRINWGAKCGFNSSMFFIEKMLIENTRIDQLQNNYKLGYSGTLFLRLNIKKHFIQAESEYIVSKGEILFDKNILKGINNYPDYAHIVSKISTIDFNLLYGYQIVQKGIYGLNVYCGPKLKHIINKYSKTEINSIDDLSLYEEFKPLQMAAILGVGVNIANIFLDFRYEIGFGNISKTIYSYAPSEGTESKDYNVIVDRHYNSITFNIGILF